MSVSKDLVDIIKSSDDKGTKAYDTSATVTRVDGGTVWVHIPGGVDETPVKRTINASAGDVVQVRVSGGSAWLNGNASAPPTDDSKANVAVEYALVANNAADSAVRSAKEASDAAADAKATADSVHDIAVQAQADAQSAQSSAQSAYNSASTAISQLSVVENIVGVLDLISQNGTYAVTTDTEPQQDKWYFTRSGTGTPSDPYVYNIIVPDSSDDPSALGYYELVDIDQSIQNYVSSHLALTSEGLYLQNGDTRILLSTTDGLIMYDQNGNQIAQYGNSAIIGDSLGFHIEIDSTEIGFYQAAQKVAYINGNKLYITQSVVLQQMDVGTPVADGGLGQWSWKVHEVNGANNLYLKWLG